MRQPYIVMPPGGAHSAMAQQSHGRLRATPAPTPVARGSTHELPATQPLRTTHPPCKRAGLRCEPRQPYAPVSTQRRSASAVCTGCQQDGKLRGEGVCVLGLLGFYDEMHHSPGQPNGSLQEAVQPVGETDEADLVAYLDAGHFLIDVMEGGRDVITGSAHRHSLGCSSLVTDGTWLWRQDFPHYLETHHVLLPGEFTEHARGLNYQVPALITTEFAPHYNETLPLVGWSSAVPWRSPAAVLEPEPRTVTSKAEFDAAMLARARNRPQGRWAKPRKPRRA